MEPQPKKRRIEVPQEQEEVPQVPQPRRRIEQDREQWRENFFRVSETEQQREDARELRETLRDARAVLGELIDMRDEFATSIRKADKYGSGMQILMKEFREVLGMVGVADREPFVGHLLKAAKKKVKRTAAKARED